MLQVWNDPITYLGSDTGLGSNTDEIQKKLKQLYNDAGIKIMISAFGS